MFKYRKHNPKTSHQLDVHHTQRSARENGQREPGFFKHHRTLWHVLSRSHTEHIIMKQPAKTPRRIEAPDMSIDWEDLPSLAYLLVEAESMFGNQPVWLETLPSGFDDLAPSDPFREPLPGMAIREVNEPEIFKLFFGQRSQ